jgi:transposase
MTRFRTYNQDQLFLLPPSLKDWLKENHVASFISDVVDTLDLSEILKEYDHKDQRGYPAYHPAMMLKILVYGYSRGIYSSRKIAAACEDDVSFRVLSSNQMPDHDSITRFRRKHLKEFKNLFLQVLKLAEAAGLVKLGHVALDGSKIKANASKNKAMSYGRMVETEKRLKQEIADLTKIADQTDAQEDRKYGKGKRGDELPLELARRESRLKKIQEAKAALEAQALEQAEAERREKNEDNDLQPPAGGNGGKTTNPKDFKPNDKSQRNFTDPESRIMRDGRSKSFEQCYNVQAAVDGVAQIIVAADVTQEANDKKQLLPMTRHIVANVGAPPGTLSADAGYFSEDNVTSKELELIELYIPPDRLKHSSKTDVKKVGRIPDNIKPDDRMRRKLSTTGGKRIYAKRKCIVEPVFGQIKEARSFRRFSFRGLEKVKCEWNLVCLVHNVLKLLTNGWRPCRA